jgi:hypothetical protein
MCRQRHSDSDPETDSKWQLIIPDDTTAGRGKFIAHLDGRQLCNRTFAPLIAAARTLAAEGYDPATTITMRHGGSTTDALVSTIGQAASVCVVEERDQQPPRFRNCQLQGQDGEIDGWGSPLIPGLHALDGDGLPSIGPSSYPTIPESGAAPTVALSSA